MCVIQTYTGRLFHPLDPQTKEICIEDIAHALSMICRFTGHCRKFYSVAEHSVNVARLVPREFQLTALMHDAAEAYMGDISSPLKRSEKMSGYRIKEWELQQLINARFLNPWQWCDETPTKTADRTMTGFEALQLLNNPLLDAYGWKPYTELAQAEPLLQNFELRCYGPEQAENQFMTEFRRLTA